MEHGDKVHGDGDGLMLKKIKLNLKRRKRKTKTEMIKSKVYDRFLFCTQDTKVGVCDLGSIAVL